MITESKNVEILARATNATTQRTRVRLDEVQFDPDRYFHRDTEALSEERLASLMDSMVLEGIQVPIEFYQDQGRKILIKGHRRVTGCRILAGKNTAGFSLDMEVEAIEVLGATPQDRLIRSIVENEVRLNLDRIGRIRVSKKLLDAGVQVERAAHALGISVKSYERDLTIAKHLWMFQHVIDLSVGPTHAATLLAEAEKAGRVIPLKEDLDSWIAGKKLQIRQKEKLRKAQGGRELRPAEKQVKNLLPNHLVAHWVELLRSNQRFDDDAQWIFSAGIEKETDQLRISSVSLNLKKAPLQQLMKVGSKLSLLAKELGPVIQERHEQESRGGEPAPAKLAYDTDYLRQLGLDDAADELEEEARQASEPDGEEDSARDQHPPREELDLTSEIQLPPAQAAELSTEEDSESESGRDQNGKEV